MKIIVEKINDELNHSITKNDIKILLEIIPKDWIGVAHVFKISSQLYDKSKWDRYVIQNNTTFNILSRGIQKQLVIKDLLIELALRPNKVYPAYGHQLNSQQIKKVEQIILPYYDDFFIKIGSVN